MKYLKRIIPSIVGIFLIISLLASPAWANSARREWEGTDATGAIITGEDCPVVVEHESLTFDIQQFPKTYYEDEREFMTYSDKVSAEYTFYNPAEYSVDATLVFPFGPFPDYGVDYRVEPEGHVSPTDSDRYDITVDGKAVKKTLRHTLKMFGHQFNLEEDMAQLHDGFMEDPFYSLDTPVTTYTFKAENVDLGDEKEGAAAFTFYGDPEKTKLHMKNEGCEAIDEGIRLICWVGNDNTLTINIIGESLSDMPEWKFYENMGCEKEISGTMTLVNTETKSFKEYVMRDYIIDSGILDFDWYNAKVAAMNFIEESYGRKGYISTEEIDGHFFSNLMRWYQYDITIDAGERIVNKVTAPIYPAIDAGYEPPAFNYTYLLSPAQTWADFGTLDVFINTPYYIIEGEQKTFEKNGTGYELHSDGLPTGELNFTLCSEKETKRKSNVRGVFVEIEIAAFVIAGTIAVLIILLLIKIIKSIVRKVKGR